MGAGRCSPAQPSSGRVSRYKGVRRRLGPFIAHGMAGGGGAERPGAGGLLPPALRQHRRRVSPGARRGGVRAGPGRGALPGLAERPSRLQESRERLSVCSKLCYAVGGAPYQITGCALGFFLQIYLLDVAQVRPGWRLRVPGAPGAAWPRGWSCAPTPGGCGFPPGPVPRVLCGTKRGGGGWFWGAQEPSYRASACWIGVKHGGKETRRWEKSPWAPLCWIWGL